MHAVAESWQWVAGGEEGEEPEQHQSRADGAGDGLLCEADDWDVPQRL